MFNQFNSLRTNNSNSFSTDLPDELVLELLTATNIDNTRNPKRFLSEEQRGPSYREIWFASMPSLQTINLQGVDFEYVGSTYTMHHYHVDGLILTVNTDGSNSHNILSGFLSNEGPFAERDAVIRAEAKKFLAA